VADVLAGLLEVVLVLPVVDVAVDAPVRVALVPAQVVEVPLYLRGSSFESRYWSIAALPR